MPLLRSSLRNKLILVFLAPTALILSMYGVFAYAVSRSGLEDELGLRLLAVGQTLSSQLSGGVQAAQLERLDTTMERVITRQRARLEAVRVQTQVRRIFLFDRELKSLIDTREQVTLGQRLYTLDADRLEIERAFATGAATTSILFTDEDGTRYKNAYVPIFLDEERTQVVAVLGVEASASYFDLMTNFASGLALMGVFGLLLVVLVGVLFARRLTEPLNTLVDAAQRLGQGRLDDPVIELRPDMQPQDEIQFLARAFEEMRLNIVSRDQQLQMMLSGIAHEVRNPLGGMELFCGMLHEDLVEEQGDPNAAAKLDKVERIQRELGYLAKVVNDFLDFARHQPLEPERISALALAQEVHNLLFGQLLETGCELQVQVEPSELELTGDPERLRRAMINAVRNAYQASPQGGVITLSVHATSFDMRRITIADHGAGIPPEQLQEILTPFFTTKEKGSGLGLAMIQKVVEQHGGLLTLESALGEGTQVHLDLPFDPEIKAVEAAIPEGWLG